MKKVPVVEVVAPEAAGRVAAMPVEMTLAMADLAGAIKEGFLAFCASAGLLAVAQVMAEEVTEKIGAKGKHDPARAGTRNGSAPGSVALGGRRVPVRRPRATLAGGGEVHLDSYEVFSANDLLTQIAVERMLAGVATRRHALVAEPLGAELEAVARGDSKSAVSRRFKAATAEKLAELIGRDLSEIDVAALMIDGILFAEVCCVVALAITADGTKIPVGLWDGDTENTTVVKDLLADLVARGLRFEDGILVVIDGSKALAAGVKRVFGKRALIQRCTLHKRRNVGDYLDPVLARAIDRQLARAFNDLDPARGLKVARGIAAQLEAKYPSAANSLREGLEDMFTVRRVGASDRLARSLGCTNAIESVMSVVRTVTGRVKTWKDTEMVRRWVGVGILEAERSFRRIKGCSDMPALTKNIRAKIATLITEDGQTASPIKYDQAA